MGIGGGLSPRLGANTQRSSQDNWVHPAGPRLHLSHRSHAHNVTPAVQEDHGKRALPKRGRPPLSGPREAGPPCAEAALLSLLGPAHLLRVHKVTGHARSLHVPPLQPKARQSQEQAQLPRQAGQEVAPAHVRK